MNELSFSYLKYKVQDIKAMITACPDIANFVFCVTFSKGKANFELTVFAKTATGSFDTNLIQNLPVAHSFEPMTFSGPLIMVNNYVDLADMNQMIEGAADNDYLLFSPSTSEMPYISYTIALYDHMGSTGAPGSATDPCPPNPPGL
jgi:hypothetical protein